MVNSFIASWVLPDKTSMASGFCCSQGIVSPDVEIFRGATDEGYPFYTAEEAGADGAREIGG